MYAKASHVKDHDGCYNSVEEFEEVFAVWEQVGTVAKQRNAATSDGHKNVFKDVEKSHEKIIFSTIWLALW